MPVVEFERLIALQNHAERIRNICILAHVDHGKTSLSDILIATNGIISPKLAGKVRYLDSRPDEQLRGITMESSAISLCFSMARRGMLEAESQQKDYLINLIDSPGHVDFSSEVSTASRLCDGAIVLVDAVEGVCSQTVTVLRQTWIENMKPLLVINKIDRLVCELKMTTMEAYTHLSRLVEEVNAVLGSFFQGERMEEDLQWREKMEMRICSTGQATHYAATRLSPKVPPNDQSEASHMKSAEEGVGFEEKDDESIYFTPGNNNIIFSSAIDGWAFTIGQFASIYEKKLGYNRKALEKVLWGDFYLDPKTKKVLSSKHLKGRALKPLFVQLILDNIWAVYEATIGGSKGKGDPIKLEKITNSLSIVIPPHLIRSRDPRVLMQTVFSSWLPLATAVLVSVIEYIPSPPKAQAERLSGLIDLSPGAASIHGDIRESITSFSTSADSPAVAYVSKMVSVSAADLPENRRKYGSSMSSEEAREISRLKRLKISQAKAASEDSRTILEKRTDSSGKSSVPLEQEGSGAEADVQEPERLIGFARLYSGSLSVGDSVYVLHPKFTPANPYIEPVPRKVKITALYMFMGRSLESLETVPAGVVFGVGGLEGHILKTGTLSTRLEGGINLAGVAMGTQPIVRVALEPSNPRDLGKLIQGMRLLEQSDPCAQYEVLESGEHVIQTAGELHLERCLKDLRERFARCEITAGEPIVPFRESIVSNNEMVLPKDKEILRGTVIEVSNTQHFSVRLRVRPLPTALVDFLSKNTRTIRYLYAVHKVTTKLEEEYIQQVDRSVEIDDLAMPESFNISNMSANEFFEELKNVAKAVGEDVELWSQAVEKIAAFGPRRVGPNILVDFTKEGFCKNFFPESIQPDESTNQTKSDVHVSFNLADRIAYAFQLATAHGPLCNEPVHGTCVILEEIIWNEGFFSPAEDTQHYDSGRLTGEIIRSIREAIREGFLDWSPRLMLAMYSCEIQAQTEVLGRVYGVITRRRGRILSEALNEGTPFFTITAVLPVAESFGFSDEIRKRTSGGASPQLRFRGFEMLDQDPFWVPCTEDELEDLGELADRENVAKRYMDVVRKRKGLLIKGNRMIEGEKARTLKK